MTGWIKQGLISLDISTYDHFTYWSCAHLDCLRSIEDSLTGAYSNK